MTDLLLRHGQEIEADAWDRFVSRHAAGHVLQTSPWAELKASFGWSAQRVALADRSDGTLVAGAQVLYRRLPAGLGWFAYVPRGPLVAWEAIGGDQSDDGQAMQQFVRVLEALRDVARARGAVGLMVEPEVPDSGAARKALEAVGLSPAPVTVQPPRTLVVSLLPEEDEILAAMKSKTRYNVRLAGRKGVTVRQAEEQDIPAFNALMETTADRNEFGVHDPAYYRMAYDLFVPRGWATLLLAEVEGQSVAAVMVFALGSRSWYFYGASANVHRNLMPTYLLQWEAMRWAKAKGCATYDLWGVPDADKATLEDEFLERGDGLWGVYRFKRGWGGQLERTVGAWDQPLAPLRYRAYRWLAGLRHQATSGFG